MWQRIIVLSFIFTSCLGSYNRSALLHIQVPNDFVSVHCDNLIERKDTITGITFYFDGVTVPCYCLLEPTNREIYPHWQINLKYYNSRDEKWYDWQTLRPSMWKDWRLGVPEFSVRPQGKSAAQFVIYRNGLEMLTQNHVVLYPSGSPRPNVLLKCSPTPSSFSTSSTEIITSFSSDDENTTAVTVTTSEASSPVHLGNESPTNLNIIIGSSFASLAFITICVIVGLLIVFFVHRNRKGKDQEMSKITVSELQEEGEYMYKMSGNPRGPTETNRHLNASQSQTHHVEYENTNFNKESDNRSNHNEYSLASQIHQTSTVHVNQTRNDTLNELYYTPPVMPDDFYIKETVSPNDTNAKENKMMQSSSNLSEYDLAKELPGTHLSGQTELDEMYAKPMKKKDIDTKMIDNCAYETSAIEVSNGITTKTMHLP